jgi:hypothetical protein
MSRTITLPARDEGPHSWLGKLVRDDAEKRLAAGVDRSTPLAELIQSEWEWLRRGWAWAKPDRTGLTLDAPNEYLMEIVRRHAEHHLEISRQLDASLPPDHPVRIEKAKRPVQVRLAAIRAAIWAHLIHGFCRIADDSDEILWWHLLEERFVPFDADYQTKYFDWQATYRGITRAVTEPDNRPYLGPRQSKYGLGED